MLILTRKLNESVVIGGDVVVRILRVQGDRVRIGIQAPRNIPVTRSEILFDQPQSLHTISAVVNDS